MRFDATKLDGAVVVEADQHVDERGSFFRTFCEDELAKRGLPVRFPQCNISHNPRAGTLRGMHLNVVGHQESKLVRCVSGAIHDVVVDLREGSSTFLEWIGVDLTAGNGRALFVPEGFAHGFITLADDTDVWYHMGRAHEAGAGIGFRWDDPAFGIAWPAEPTLLSERDRTYPDFDPAVLSTWPPAS
jgi:dTDP-4-dehydrorhamnose 3,5-epimerase